MKKRYFKALSFSLPMLFVASMMIIMGVMIPLIYNRFESRMIDQYARMAEGATELMEDAFDADKVDEYIEKNFDLPEYNDLVNYLYTVRDSFPDILYMYIYRFEEDGGHVVIDLDADWVEDGEGYEPGYLWGLDEIEEPFASHLKEVSEGKQIDGYSEYNENDGYLYTYTRPVFKSDGSYACTLCVDFSMDYISGIDRDFTEKLAFMLILISAVVLAFDFYLVRKRITAPIDKLSHCAGSFAYETEDDRKNNILLLEELDIKTGDEIEDVYNVLKSVARDSFDATAHLANALTDLKAREGMITAMAADYRSIYHVDLDKDVATCMRASVRGNGIDMWEGRVFTFSEIFTEYAHSFVAEKYRDEFLRFIDPDNIRTGLATESMLSNRYLAVHKDGTQKYEMLRIAGVRTIEERDDNIVHAIGVGFSDVDRQTREEMEQNRALSEALVRAEDANAAKTAFLSSMSHEIRTPMNAIIGIDNIALKDPAISETTRLEFEKIGSSARHLLSLINDILDMSRIESGRMELNDAEFSFTEFIDQIDTIIQGQCDEKILKYERKTIGSVDEFFIGDALRIRQIIINILGNSVKFTDSPGNVEFTIEQTDIDDDNCRLRFTMKDTGVGIDKEFIPKLFESFSQEDATTTNRYGGSGLGMAITKNMVDLMGGSINVDSEKGVGTTFTVDIPIKRSHHVSEAGDDDQAGPTFSVEGLHVLIAEDMDVNAQILIMMLDMEKITSEWAKNGQIAVDMFAQSEEGHFDAVLMDMRMPVMDGLSATREIRKLDRPDAQTVPIIALTANVFEEDVNNCIEAGMNAHLAKPLEMDLLKDALSRHLSR